MSILILLFIAKYSKIGIPMDFHEWMTQKYIDWRGQVVGHSGSVTEFARLFGVSQPLMSDWLKKGGIIPRSQKAISALVKVYGFEVYEVLGLPRPDQYQEVPHPELPAEVQLAIQSATSEISKTLQSIGLSPSSPEAKIISQKILLKHLKKLDPDAGEG